MNTQKKDFQNKINEFMTFVKENNFVKEDLIKVLHRAQKSFGYVPDEIQIIIAKKLDIPLSEINGVVSFYSFFTNVPRGKYAINVCLGTACYVKGAQKILEAFSSELGISLGETTQDGLFTLEACRCIGACGLSPVIMINEDVHGRFEDSNVSALIKEYRKKSQE